MADEKLKPVGPTYIDGVGSTPAIDTSGEIVDLAGIDCSSLIGGPFNYEHKSDVPAQICGKILEYKKIFSEKDCENDRHKYYWEKCKSPFLYVMGRLFDDKKDSAKEVAALFIDAAAHPDEPPMIGFSIEGSKVDKKGIVVTKSIARKITLTGAPANKQCIAQLISAKPEKPDADSIFKSETVIELLKKAEPMKKAEESKPPNKLPRGWTASKTRHPNAGTIISFTHDKHHPVTIHRDKETGLHEVRQAGKSAGLKGQKGSFPSAKQAVGHALKYVHALHEGKTFGNVERNVPSNLPITKSDMKKGMSAGSGMASPGNLVGGAALSKESLDKKMKKALTRDKYGPANTTGHEKGVHVGTEFRDTEKPYAGQSDAGYLNAESKNPRFSRETQNDSRASALSEHRKVLSDLKNMPKPKLGKTEWLTRAEQEYASWSKREEFENYMAKNMPHLAKGEIIAIGQAICLKKSLKAEKKLAKLDENPQQNSWVAKKEKN
jgi:hypothetical protein